MSKPIFSDLFTFKSGRRNRQSYVILLLAGLSVVLAVSAWIFIPAYLAQQEYLALMAAGRPLPAPAPGSAIAVIFGATLALLRLVLLLCAVIVVWAAGAQRFHDLGMSGWSLLWIVVPVINLYFIYLLLARPGQPGDNQYGPDPLRTAAATG